ncbi:MAG: class I SAM-dependent methyltransferase [Steroidobacteraceae bacterium]
MPSSLHYHIADVLSIVGGLQPASFLDVGCGFGRWGFLAREQLDVAHERYARESWKTRIDAVEVFEPYICSYHRYLYDNIYIGRIEELLPTLGAYDVILAGEILEHIEKAASLATLAQLREKARKALIVSVPLGHDWPQGEVLDNPAEAHVSTWTVEELKRLGARRILKYRHGKKRMYAVAVWFKPEFAPPPFPVRVVRAVRWRVEAALKATRA